VERGNTMAEEAIHAVDTALGVLEGIKADLQHSMAGQKTGSRLAAERRVAREALTGEKEKAAKVSGDTATMGKARAESSALEMAKGTFIQLASER
jgi:hypothetical protein